MTINWKAPFKKISNIAFAVLLIFAAIKIIPRFYANYQKIGQEIKVKERVNLLSGKKLLFPPDNSNVLILFWATWCPPCKLEMQRLKESVEKSKISSEKIIAINMYEDETTIKNFLKKNPYPFVFLSKTAEDEKLEIFSTPTTLFIKNKKIDSISEGLSLVGIWRAEYFLK